MKTILKDLENLGLKLDGVACTTRCIVQSMDIDDETTRALDLISTMISDINIELSNKLEEACDLVDDKLKIAN